MTDADVAVKDAETPDSGFEPAKKVDTETVESDAENTGALEEQANRGKIRQIETDLEKQADQKQEEEEILEEWKD